MLKLLVEKAPAKINLFLRVVGRRPDGYHELDSVFIPVSLWDRVRIEMRVETLSADRTAVVFRCDRDDIPRDEQNLAWRAADIFLREFGATIHVPRDVAIDLHKEIPSGAGLGGGSSDAGAVLRMMAALCRVNDERRLTQIALALGADIPFFLRPRIAHVRGVGEIIEPIDTVADTWKSAPLRLVIAVPPVEVSTVQVFRALLPAQWSGPAPAEHLRALAAGRIIPGMLHNDLAAVAMTQYPEIARLREALIEAGAKDASMTGSGGAVFGLFSDAERASSAADWLRRELPNARYHVVNSLA